LVITTKGRGVRVKLQAPSPNQAGVWMTLGNNECTVEQAKDLEAVLRAGCSAQGLGFSASTTQRSTPRMTSRVDSPRAIDAPHAALPRIQEADAQLLASIRLHRELGHPHH
jgi:hypothetical protein